MTLKAIACRRRLAQWRKDSAGADRETASLLALQIRSPERVTNLYVPGAE
jgi:hypothetical protein